LKGDEIMYDDVDELIKIYDLFIQELEFFSSDFKIQYDVLKESQMNIANDIANEFSYIEKDRATILYEHEWLTREQYDLVLQIENKLSGMSDSKNLWWNDVLEKSSEWEECRTIGKELLKSLGY